MPTLAPFVHSAPGHGHAAWRWRPSTGHRAGSVQQVRQRWIRYVKQLTISQNRSLHFAQDEAVLDCGQPMGAFLCDSAGNISYKEFSAALFSEEDAGSQDSAPPKSLTGKTCYKDNAWLKGSNGIFDGIFGGGSVDASKYELASAFPFLLCPSTHRLRALLTSYSCPFDYPGSCGRQRALASAATSIAALARWDKPLSETWRRGCEGHRSVAFAMTHAAADVCSSRTVSSGVCPA